ncbi:MAG: hypothetical protein QOI10_2727 [Solirubrobacterales bacterium]|jgi:tetratricopeptide (TPR) repeat protein|nr:hypothetical protein [Solirubrobacterales bacterium]
MTARDQDSSARTASDPRARRVAFCAVLATLAAAVAGYLQSEASKDAGASGTDAQELSAAAFAEGDRASEQANLQLEYFLRQQLHLRDAALDVELRRFSNVPARELRFDEKRSRFLAKAALSRALVISRSAISGVAPITSQSIEGPDKDPAFPARFLLDNGEGAATKLALSDAATEYANERGGQVAVYVAIIAIFAVAIYLFGFSLSPHGRPNRPLFATTGVLLAAAGLIWGAKAAVAPPARPDDRAAAAYAEAQVATGIQDYDTALSLYNEAIDLRPKFALAYRYRAQARFAAASPQAKESARVDLSSPDALRGTIADLERAQDLGLTNGSIVNQLGVSYLLLGLQERDPAILRQAVELGEKDAELNPDNPVYGLAIAHLALGEEDVALTLMQRAAAEIAARDPSQVADAMTELEVLSDHYPELRESAAGLKELLVKTVLQARVPTPDGGLTSADRDVDSLDAYVWAGGLEAAVDFADLRPHHERTWIEWYRRDPQLGWFAMPFASGAPGVGQGSLIWDYGRRFWFAASYYLRDAPLPVCLPAAAYRAELYVEGKLVDTDKFRSRTASLEPAVDRVIGYRICRPGGWQPSSKALPGLVNGFTNDDGSRGVYVIRLADSEGLGSIVPESRRARYAVAPIVKAFSGLLPASATASHPVPVAFIGTDDEAVRSYTYDGGQVRIGVSRQLDGSLFVGLVYGPDAWWTGSSEARDVFGSISERG